MKFDIQSVETRRYFYKVAAAIAPLLLVLNLATPAEVDIYLNIGAAVLGLSVPALALTNSPKKGETMVIVNDK